VQTVSSWAVRRTHPLLYEINTRCWLAALSVRAGRRLTLAEVPEEEFAFWQHCGFSHVWLMGVWTVGARSRAWSLEAFKGQKAEFPCEHLAGSPYAITGYTVSSELGGEEALAAFRRRLHAHGIRLVLDFIPNHTALDHPWVETNPEFYVTSAVARPGTIQPLGEGSRWFALGHCGFGEPWCDTLQLDYRHAGLRDAMRAELLSVAERCDGVRCDMAMLALNDVFARTWREFPREQVGPATDFWAEALPGVRHVHPEFLFLAEVYWDLETRLQELGFDYTYDKRLYDRLLAKEARAVADYLRELPPHFVERSAHFIENHDEPRVAGLLAPERHRAAALLSAALPGLRFFHEGQFLGWRHHANVHLAARQAEPDDRSIAEFYAQLFTALKDAGVGQGEWQLAQMQTAWEGNESWRHLVVVQWRQRTSFSLAVVNLSHERSQGYARFPLPRELPIRWRLRDCLGSEVHERSTADLLERGLYLDVAPHAAQLFHAEPAASA
jgi:hypothetical protein